MRFFVTFRGVWKSFCYRKKQRIFDLGRPESKKSSLTHKPKELSMKDKKPTKKGKSRFLEKPRSPKNQRAGESYGPKGKNPEAKPKASVSHHDKFFKKAFSEPALAKVLAKVILYPQELKVCDLKSLKVEEKQAKANKMDLILTLGLKDFPKEQIHILILVEHKSQYSKKFWQQFLEYQTILLIEAKSPFVLIPAVFYHGRSRPAVFYHPGGAVGSTRSASNRLF